MALSQFIRDNLEAILLEWESFARTLLPAAASMSNNALRDHASQILLAIADDIETDQTSREQRQKSLGLGPDSVGKPTSAATSHGELRHVVGFDLGQLVAEYRALRASVLRLWVQQPIAPIPQRFDDMVRFNEAIDQAIAESVASYSLEIGKARDTFTAILGHDLRSPLGAIVMSAHNAASFDLPEPARQAMAAIQRSAKSMQLMIRDLLDFAGTRLGREMPMRPEESSLEEACHAALAELMTAHPTRTFGFEAEGDLHGYFDPARIRQALSNLLNNAVDHGETGHPVTVRARAELSDLVVEVVNVGNSSSADALLGIMDPACRARLPAGPGSSGLGLGLYIAQQVAKAHRGSVTAASAGRETRFALRFPKAPPVVETT